MFETGIKVVDLIEPYLKAGRSVSLAERAWARRAHHGVDSQRGMKHGGVSVFAGVGERTREGNDLWLEMSEGGVIVPGNSEKSRAL